MSARADTQWLQLRQTEAQLARWRKVAQERPPAGGWISAVRQAIGMSVAQLADRLGISRTSLAKMEHREVGGGITLDALRRAADALDCDVVYAIVPRTGSLERAVKARAELIAGVLVGRAGHSMSLEAQTVEHEETTAQQKVIARRLLAEWPRDLWDISWDRRTGDERAGGG
jgi:predicted DNA-binding mobile mystery protein A